ncbi:MAG TPA: ferritin-like domain-containing protein [Bryobacteraceae bacterium]
MEGSTLANTADQIASDERTHVTLLRTLLTGLAIQPIAKPVINLNALSTGFESQEAFVTLARAFEDTGVSAYGGAAPLISDKTILGYAARILATEAEHTGNLRLGASLYQAPGFSLDALDTPPPPGGTNFISGSGGLTAVRTPGQVLSIVFGGPNLSSGAFFPSGVNGRINASSTT